MARCLRSQWLIAVLVSLSSMTMLVDPAVAGFDLHHDGYVVATAVAIRDGLVPHTDFYSQYGPIPPFAVSWLLLLFPGMGPVLAVRLTGLVAVGVITALIVLSPKWLRGDWGVTRTYAVAGALIWVGLCYAFADPELVFLAWPPLFSSPVMLVALFASLAALHGTRTFALASVGGVAVGLAPFVRINSGVPLVIAFTVVLGVNWMVSRSPRARKAFGGLVFGIVAVWLVVATMLLANGQSGLFLLDSVIGPLTWAATESSGWSPATNIPKIFVAYGALLLLTLAGSVAVFLIMQRKFSKKLTREVSIFVYGAISALLLLGGFPSFTLRLLNGSPELMKSTSASNSYLYFFFVGSVLTIAIACIWFLKTYVRARETHQVRMEWVSWLLMLATVAAFLTQIWPTWDPRHVWWAAPLLIPVGLGLASKLTRASSRALLLAVGIILAPYAISVVGERIHSENTGSSPQEGLLKGLRAVGVEGQQFVADERFLLSVLPEDSRPIFLTGDGAFSAVGGHFRSFDRYFVYWGPAPGIEGRLTSEMPPVVIASDAFSSGNQERLENLGYEVVATNGKLRVLSVP